MPPEETISKIFRVALFIFATTFGIGLYALIGAPVLRINYEGYASKLLTKAASVGASTLAIIPAPHLIPEKGPITHELSSAANDFPLIKDIITSDNFGKEGTREIIFTKNSHPASAPVLLSHFVSIELPTSLGHLLLDQRYFVTKRATIQGTLIISALDAQSTYANMLQSESLLAAPLMNLAHPTMSISEVRMLSQIRFASLTIANVDARAITTSDNKPILIWGIHNNLLVISGDTDAFTAALEN